MGELTRHYSDRLGVITGEQLQAAAERFGLGTVLGAEPATSGLFGQNVVLTTSEGRFVLRGHPHGRQQLVKERLVAQLIRERSSLPAPWPYEVCADPSLFGWTYAIMPYIEGTTGSTLWKSLDNEGKTRLAAAHGEAGARLHEVGVEFCGPYLWEHGLFVPKPDFADFALEQLDFWRRACRASNGLSGDDERFIDDVIDRCAEALRVPFEPVLVHHDFTPGNVGYVTTPDGFRASGLFDLMEAYFGDGEEDLVRVLWRFGAEQRRAFIGAYTSRRPFRPGAADRLAIYALSDWLVIWEYGKRNGLWFQDVSFVERAEPIVAAARAASDT